MLIWGTAKPAAVLPCPLRSPSAQPPPPPHAAKCRACLALGRCSPRQQALWYPGWYHLPLAAPNPRRCLPSGWATTTDGGGAGRSCGGQRPSDSPSGIATGAGRGPWGAGRRREQVDSKSLYQHSPAGFLEQRCLRRAGVGGRPCTWRMSVPTPHCRDGETEATWRRAAATRGPASQSCPGCHPEPAPLLTSYSDILRVLDLCPHLPLFLLEWGPGDSSAEVQPAQRFPILVHLCALLVKPVSACLLQCGERVTMAHSCKQLNYQVTNPSQCTGPC